MTMERFTSAVSPEKVVLRIVVRLMFVMERMSRLLEAQRPFVVM